MQFELQNCVKISSHTSAFVSNTAWKQLPTWYQISEANRMIPPDVQLHFAERMNANTLSLNASHASYVSHPNEIAELILKQQKEARDNKIRCPKIEITLKLSKNLLYTTILQFLAPEVSIYSNYFA